MIISKPVSGMWLISMSELKLVYFSWVRERIGLPEETLAIPDDVKTISDLARYLGQRGEHYAYAFENPAIVRAAIDRKHVKPDTPIAGAKEIAFFPPMTGG